MLGLVSVAVAGLNGGAAGGRRLQGTQTIASRYEGELSPEGGRVAVARQGSND